MKVELREMTNSHLIRDSPVMISCDHPVGEILLLPIAAQVLEWQHGDRWPVSRHGGSGGAAGSASVTSPMKRMPLRGTVRIRR